MLGLRIDVISLYKVKSIVRFLKSGFSPPPSPVVNRSFVLSHHEFRASHNHSALHTTDLQKVKMNKDLGPVQLSR